ncbi:hypothetical protein [Polaromonas sp. JS666]|uniref:hypothetical protein n=1 Tax=Polaromonas sp. (strain JS666 / ATCC BAA-500) TaxID=296591 RepID=UPI0009445809|nr:hypothetical protein [Polaromonas sp. JS666]
MAMLSADHAIAEVLAQGLREKAAIRTARWIANALGSISCITSIVGWAILAVTYVRLQSVLDAPGPNGLSRNLHTLIGAGYFFLLMQAVSAVFLLLALIPSRDRLRTLLYGFPIAAFALLLCVPRILGLFRS